MADYNVNMKQWNGTSFDNVLPLAYNALKVGGKTYDEIVGFVNSLVGIGGYNARIAWGSYTGNGKYGSGNPNSLTFDFTPVLVVIGSNVTTHNVAWPTVIIRGANSGHADSSAEQIQVTWTANGLQWYNDRNQSYQNNYTGKTYYYVALGCSAE